MATFDQCSSVVCGRNVRKDPSEDASWQAEPKSPWLEGIWIQDVLLVTCQAPRVTTALSTSLPVNQYLLHVTSTPLYPLQLNAFKVFFFNEKLFLFAFFETFVWCVLNLFSFPPPPPQLTQIYLQPSHTMLCPFTHQSHFMLPRPSWMCEVWWSVQTSQGNLRENQPFVSQQLTIARSPLPEEELHV